MELQSGDGRRRMAQELKRIQAQFGLTIKDFKDASHAIEESLRITEEIVDRALAAAQAGTLEEEKEITSILRQVREPSLRAEKT